MVIKVINRVKVDIKGGKYIIATGEKEEYVQGLAKELERQITGIQNQDSRLSLNECLVLCCMHYLDSYKKSEEGTDHMRSQLTDYLEEAAKATQELEESRREVENLKRQLELRRN